MLPSTLKYLYSVEPVRMHFPAKQPCTNDTVFNAAMLLCSVSVRPVHSTRRILTERHDTGCCIDTIWPPEDEKDIARNVYM